MQHVFDRIEGMKDMHEGVIGWQREISAKPTDFRL